MKLSDRQVVALRWLAKVSEPGSHLAPWADGGYAFILGRRLADEDLGEDYAEASTRGKRNGNAQGAANTLVSLKRRGLATNSTPGGEAFQSVQWGITEEGVAALDELDETEPEDVALR